MVKGENTVLNYHQEQIDLLIILLKIIKDRLSAFVELEAYAFNHS